MQKLLKKSNFPHFFRKCSESIRIALQSNISGSNQAIFLSNFILSAEKMHKMSDSKKQQAAIQILEKPMSHSKK